MQDSRGWRFVLCCKVSRAGTSIRVNALLEGHLFFGQLFVSSFVNTSGNGNGGALGAGAAGDESEYGEVVEHDYGDNGGTYDGGRTEVWIHRKYTANHRV